MFLGELKQEITTLRGIGPATAARLKKLGVGTIQDLLLHLPRGYEDRTDVTPLADVPEKERVVVAATVMTVTDVGRGRTRTVKAVVSDDTGQASLVCFGRPFLRSVLRPGEKFFIWGSFTRRFGELQSSNFEVEPWNEEPSANFGKVLPVYPLTEGFTQGVLRRAVKSALDSFGAKIEDE